MNRLFLRSIFLFFSIFTFVFFVFPFAAFADSTKASWYREAWEYMDSKDVFTKMRDETIQPHKEISRAQLALLIFETRKMIPAMETNSPFIDVSSDNSYYNAIITLTKNKVIHGYPDETFRPNDTLTRAQMAAIIARAYAIHAETTKILPIQDIDEKHWAYPAIKALYEKEIVSGQPTKRFSPSQTLTWAEAVQVLYRAEKYQESITTPFVEDEEEIKLIDAVALNEDGRYVELTFSAPIDKLHKSQLKITNTASRDIHGIQAVELIHGGKKAIVTLYKGAGLDTLTDYTIEFNRYGHASTFSFYREEYIKMANVKITDVHIKDRTITVKDSNNHTKTFEVPSTIELDFVDAYNREANIWHNSKDMLTLYEIKNPNKKVKKKDRFIKQYDLNEFLYITSIQDDGIAKGINGEIDLNHFDVYVRSDQMISKEDIQPGDFIMFNYKEKVLEVGTYKVTGKVEEVYLNGILIEDEVYDYNGYILGKDKDLEVFNVDTAKELLGKNITLYLNIDDKIVYVH